MRRNNDNTQKHTKWQNKNLRNNAIKLGSVFAIISGVALTDIAQAGNDTIKPATTPASEKNVTILQPQTPQCILSARQVFNHGEISPYSRHGVVALEILKSTAPQCANIGMVSRHSPFQAFATLKVQSYEYWRLHPAILSEGEKASLLLLPENNTPSNNTTLTLRAAGNSGRISSTPVPYDISHHFLSPLMTYICSNDRHGVIADYATPRCTFSAMEGMRDLDLVKIPYYLSAKEMKELIDKENQILEQSHIYIDWITEYYDSIKQPNPLTPPANTLTAVQEISKLAKENKTILTANKTVIGTSFAAPEAGNIFTKAIIAAQNNRDNKHCAKQMDMLDYIFLAAAAAEPASSKHPPIFEIDEAKKHGGAFAFNLLQGGYGWLRGERLTHLVNQACGALAQDPSLKTNIISSKKSIPLKGVNKTVFTIKGEQNPQNKALLVQRVVTFFFHGKYDEITRQSIFANIAFNGDKYRVPVHMAPAYVKRMKGKQDPHVGYIVLKGLIGATNTTDMEIKIRDSYNRKIKSLHLSGAIDVEDTGVTPDKLWSKMIDGLKNGTIKQAPTCKEKTENYFTKWKNKPAQKKVKMTDVQAARLCR